MQGKIQAQGHASQWELELVKKIPANYGKPQVTIFRVPMKRHC